MYVALNFRYSVDQDAPDRHESLQLNLRQLSSFLVLHWLALIEQA